MHDPGKVLSSSLMFVAENRSHRNSGIDDGRDYPNAVVLAGNIDRVE